MTAVDRSARERGRSGGAGPGRGRRAGQAQETMAARHAVTLGRAPARVRQASVASHQASCPGSRRGRPAGPSSRGPTRGDHARGQPPAAVEHDVDRLVASTDLHAKVSAAARPGLRAPAVSAVTRCKVAVGRPRPARPSARVHGHPHLLGPGLWPGRRAGRRRPGELDGHGGCAWGCTLAVQDVSDWHWPTPGGRRATAPVGASACSAADGAHRPRGLDEARLVDAVLELLAPDRVADDLLELVVVAPARSGARRSVSLSENRQVRSLPSAVRRMRLQSPQNGSDTGLMNPIRPRRRRSGRRARSRCGSRGSGSSG